MKKLFLFLCFVILGLPSVAKEVDMISISRYEGSVITGVEISHSFDVTLISSSFCIAEVEIPAELEKYLRFELKSDGTLVIELDKTGNEKLKKIIKNKDSRKYLKARINTAVINKLVISGAVRLNGEGIFSAETDKMNIIVSGASNVNSLSISAHDVKAVISGASRINDLSLNASGNTSINISGATNTTMSIESPVLRCNISGASRSKIIHYGISSSVDVSGASSLNISGEVEERNIRNSGASTINKSGYVVKKEN